MIHVFSVDDQPLVCEGIAAVVNGEPDMLMIGEASNGRDAIDAFRHCRPDVTLMDIDMADMSGIDAIAAIREDFPKARVVMLTTCEGDIAIANALNAGAWGYVLKTVRPTELAGVIRRVHSGRKQIPPDVAARLAEHVGEEPLTDRERMVLREVATGNRNRDIAERLYISAETVKAHLKHIMEKLGANDRTQAVVIAIRRGIISL